MTRQSVRFCALASLLGAIAAGAGAQSKQEKGTAVIVPAPPVVIPTDPSNPNGPAVVMPLPPGPPSNIVLPAPVIAPASANFRLVALEFVVLNQTVDDPLEMDGAGDEIQLRTDSFEVGRFGRTSRTATTFSGVFGAPDRADFNAGSGVPGFSAAAPVGGLITGNSYPPSGHSPRGPRDLPMTVWAGTLSRGEKAALIIPTIWEMDGRDQSEAQRQFERRLPPSVQGASASLGPLVSAVALPPGSPRSGLNYDLLRPILVFDEGSRPVSASVRPGLTIGALPHAAAMRLPALMLTFDEAMRIISRPPGPVSISSQPGQIVSHGAVLPPGGILVQSIDQPALQGNYYVIYQLQRL